MSGRYQNARPSKPLTGEPVTRRSVHLALVRGVRCGTLNGSISAKAEAIVELKTVMSLTGKAIVDVVTVIEAEGATPMNVQRRGVK